MHSDQAHFLKRHGGARPPRRAFTLVELLIVMLIMVILATVMAMAMAGAEESAKASKTNTLINKLHALVMARYESYRYRRLPVSLPAMAPAAGAQARCDLMRELMRMEMPERWTDITDAPISHTYKDVSNNSVTVALMRPSVNQSYLAVCGATPNANYYPSSAKCLYLLVTMGLEESDVLENFSSGEIGTDTDGYKYFIDGWGNPIAFLRWAPGFGSPLQRVDQTTHKHSANDPSTDQTDPAGYYNKPFGTTYALYPLIYSAGADGAFDIVDDTAATFSYAANNNNPFSTSSPPFGSPGIWPSSSANSGRTQSGNGDNIHNHNLAGR